MDWLEILIPIIFVAIWILSAIFGRSQDGEDAPRRPRPEREENEVPEEVRRIQEEIRRKIEERQSGETGVPKPATGRTQPSPPSRPRPATAYGGSNPVAQGVVNYEAELAKRMKEVRATQDRVNQVRKDQGFHAPRTMRQRSTSARSPLRGRILREILHDPQGARKAFLYLEILGQPVGMRERGAIRRLWET